MSAPPSEANIDGRRKTCTALSTAFSCLILLRFQSHELDSNPRQHVGVGAEFGLQRLFAESGQISVKSGVSANPRLTKPPTNGRFLTVSGAGQKLTGLVGGGASLSLTRLPPKIPDKQGINRDIAGKTTSRQGHTSPEAPIFERLPAQFPCQAEQGIKSSEQRAQFRRSGKRSPG